MAKPCNVSAIDLQPGEIRAPKPDIYLAQLSYQYSERGRQYVHGNQQRLDTQILSSQYLIRLAHSFEVADKTAFFYAQTAIGSIEPEKALSSQKGDSGVSDTAFALGFWPYANHETKTYFGIGAYWFAPTGSYDHTRNFNMGENRYKGALQTGFQTALIGDLNWMNALDVVWSADNSNFGPKSANMAQQALYTAQSGLKYDINENFAVAANYYYTTGGETSVNGLDRNDATRLQRYQVSGIANFSLGRVTLQYGGDIKTENGFREDQRVVIRYTKLF